jgi:hypothetical protein
MVKGTVLWQQRQKSINAHASAGTFLRRIKQRYGLALYRTLVYALLVSLLVLVCSGLQALLGGTQLALIGSTLAILILFHPLRQGAQKIIRRRLHRSEQNAATLIENFGALARTRVDADILSEQLLALVQETMQPTQVSLWLFSPTRSTTRRALPTEHAAGPFMLMQTGTQQEVTSHSETRKAPHPQKSPVPSEHPLVHIHLTSTGIKKYPVLTEGCRPHAFSTR